MLDKRLFYRLACLVILSCWLGQTVRGQVNIERLRKTDDGLHFQLGATFALRDGNSEFIQVGSSGRLDYLDNRYHIFTIGSVNYGETNGQAFKNRAFLHQRFNYILNERFVGELFAQIEQDEFVLLQARLLGGAGLRINVVDTETHTIFVGAGAMFEQEELDENKVSVHPASISTVRSTNYLSTRITISESMDVQNIVYIQPRLDALDDVRILNDGRLVFHVGKHVSWTNSVLIRYDGVPPVEIESTDIDIQSGLTIQF